jgi:hypothetical protein
VRAPKLVPRSALGASKAGASGKALYGFINPAIFHASLISIVSPGNSVLSWINGSVFPLRQVQWIIVGNSNCKPKAMTLKVALLTLSFQLPGCHSLKDKRRRLKPLRDKFGSRPHIAVSETDFQDQWGRGAWQFVVIGDNLRFIDSECGRIEDACHQLDAYVVDRRREYLL